MEGALEGNLCQSLRCTNEELGLDRLSLAQGYIINCCGSWDQTGTQVSREKVSEIGIDFAEPS